MKTYTKTKEQVLFILHYHLCQLFNSKLLWEDIQDFLEAQLKRQKYSLPAEIFANGEDEVLYNLMEHLKIRTPFMTKFKKAYGLQIEKTEAEKLPNTPVIPIPIEDVPPEELKEMLEDIVHQKTMSKKACLKAINAHKEVFIDELSKFFKVKVDDMDFTIGRGKDYDLPECHSVFIATMPIKLTKKAEKEMIKFLEILLKYIPEEEINLFVFEFAQ